MNSLSILLRVFTLILIILSVSPALGQKTQSEQTGWAAWFNTYRFSPKWGMHLDVQLRSADDWKYGRNLLVRPGLTYHIDHKQNVTAGYALVRTYADDQVPTMRDLTEHRIWEQYIFAHKVGSFPLTHRFRVEQRFIERQMDDIFSQRLRYFARLIMPVVRQDGSFSKGPFAAVQNEVFLNLQNKDKLNSNIFDQNRAYLAAGYRFSSKLDVEVGYLNQFIKGKSNNTSNNALQLAFYTRF